MAENMTDSEKTLADEPISRKISTGVEEVRQTMVPGEQDSDGEKGHSPDSASVDSNIVDWDGPDDPANPRNWPKGRKILNIALVSLSVLYSSFATTMFAPGTASLASEFGITSSVVATLAVTIPSLGAGMGPLVLAPLSEMSGRVPIYWGSSLLYLACTVGCARSTNAAMFLIFRCLCGGCMASFQTCGGGTIADLLPKEERGVATAAFTAGPLLGPVLGPIIGGFVTESLGWRWTFYLILMMAGVVTTIAIATMSETNATMILRKKAARLRKETGNPDLRPAGWKPTTKLQLVERALIRPLRMLCLSPIVLLIGLYLALVFGMTYLLYATFPSVFEGYYHWSVGVSGLSYLGLGLGAAVGLLLFAALSDKMVREGGGPERRLILMMWIGPTVPIGMFWYGWTAATGVQWIVPIIGTMFMGIGTVVITAAGQIYMMDMFGPQGAASALAAISLVRNGSGAFLALAADPLYEKLGMGWGQSVLAFITLAFTPVPFLFYRYGGWLRERFPLKL